MSDICERLKARSAHLGKDSIEGELMDEAAAEIERLRIGWMPIETAPKDGTKVLLDMGDYVDIGWFRIRQEWETYRAGLVPEDAPRGWQPAPLPQPPQEPK